MEPCRVIFTNLKTALHYTRSYIAQIKTQQMYMNASIITKITLCAPGKHLQQHWTLLQSQINLKDSGAFTTVYLLNNNDQ